MSANNLSGPRRCAQELLSLFQRQSEHGLSESEIRFRREEVNRVLGEMGDAALTQTLDSLYRLAEADARRKARVLAKALAQPQSAGWLSFLRRRLRFPRPR